MNENKCLFSSSVLRERWHSLGSPSLHAVASLLVRFVPFHCSVKHGCSVLRPCAPACCSFSRKLAHHTGGTLMPHTDFQLWTGLPHTDFQPWTWVHTLPPHTDFQPWTWVHLNVPSLALLPLALLLFYLLNALCKEL